MKAQLLLLSLISISLLQGGSCLQVARPYPTPQPEHVVAALQARIAGLKSYRGEARMVFRSTQGRVKASVRMMAAQGGRLRFDVVSPIDAPLATLVTSEGRFALLDSRENRHFHGAASPCNLARLLMVRLEPEDILAALGGATPLIAADNTTLRWDSRAGQEVLILRGKGQQQTIRIDGRDKSWRVLSSEIRDKDHKVQLRLTFSQHRKVGKIIVPGVIAVEQPSHEADLLLEFKRQETNITLPKAAFERPQAEGVPSREVSCLPASRPIPNKNAPRT